jgi:hypothetical protein
MQLNLIESSAKERQKTINEIKRKSKRKEMIEALKLIILTMALATITALLVVELIVRWINRLD